MLCGLLISAVSLIFLATDALYAAQSDHGAIVFFGDSITAGYGLEPDQAYPAIIEKKLEHAGFDYPVVNAGLSGETTAAGARRVNWMLRREVAVFVLALGGNDGLRGIPAEETERNLQATIDAVRASQPDARIILTGMEAPPNMGADFTSALREIFPRLAEKNKIPLVAFLLEGVGGEPELNQADGIHPNPAGQILIAENIWKSLEPILQELAPTS